MPQRASTCNSTNIPGHSVHAIGKQADVAIVLGGDGTMLGIARELAPHQVPLIGINHGRLGFMTDVSLDQMSEALVPMLRGAYETDRRVLLDGEVRRGGKAIFHAAALNDIVVSRGVTGGMVEYTVRVDGATMYNQRADAVIVATPTGSTAYALSADGPILYPSLAGLLLVPVAPQTLSNRPIVLNDDVVIEIEITDERDAMAHFDMQSYEQLAPGDIVRVKRSAHVATLAASGRLQLLRDAAAEAALERDAKRATHARDCRLDVVAMLLSLSIRNFVIVEALDLDFAPGFTVLSGETGAGKSILIDALLLALGERGDADVVREGAQRAEISAEFRPGEHVQRWLLQNDLASDDGALIARRTIDAAGRSKSFINGSAVTLTQLRELGESLIDVHGQHAHQSLLRPASQLQLLDEHGGLTTAKARRRGSVCRLEKRAACTRRR